MASRRSSRRRVVVNGAFRPQRVTGQQRYATEIADRMIRDGAEEVRPGAFWSGSALRTWLWTLVVLPARSRGDVLVSLTARAPIWHPRQVLAVHDLFVLTNPEWYSSAYVRSHAPVLKLQLRAAAAMVAVSRPVADQVRAAIRGRSVAVASNAPSSRFFEPGSDGPVLDRLGLRRGSYLLAVGSRDPRKNLPRLAAAWSQVSESIRAVCPLAVVGGPEASFAGADVAWPPGTTVTGYLTDGELAELYGAARAVVFVSLAEGFGLPVIEAAAAGVERLVLSDIEVFRWIARDAAMYVDPGSTSEIAEALARAATAESWPAARVEVDRFDWDRSAATMREIANEVAGG